MNRREFLKYNAYGLAAVAVGSLSVRSSGQAAGAIALSMEEAMVEMVDGTPVYHWVFALRGESRPRFPGPLIFAATGDPVTIEVTNNLDEPHEFRILGAGPGGADIVSTPAVIPPNGGTAGLSFVPQAAGTFMYLDPRNAPVNRVLGLHGALVVLPSSAKEQTGVNTPYTAPTAQVQQLFDDLGVAAHFPGDPWIPLRPADAPANPNLPAGAERFLHRTRVWVFLDVDPRFNILAAAGGNAEPGGGITPAVFQRDFLPRYFLLNGKSGAFASVSDHGTHLEGFIGEPHVLRILNAGLVTHSLHLHGNHFYVLAVGNSVPESVAAIDTMTLRTVEGDVLADDSGIPTSQKQLLRGSSRIDCLVPFIRPPDIAGDPGIPLRDLIPEELSLVLGDVSQSHLEYPMHDHTEPSQTAAGGNYPQGAVCHMVFHGDVDKVPFPEGRVRIARTTSTSGGHRGKH
jgi:hypothetical protein